MAFMVKHMVGGQLKNLTGGLGEEKPEAEKTEAAAQGMTQEEFEQYQQQLVEENDGVERLIGDIVNMECCRVDCCAVVHVPPAISPSASRFSAHPGDPNSALTSPQQLALSAEFHFRI
ncbi:hypothetical protein AAFF_G00301660 [Aldrovandia affinis]|uniref:Complexin-3 n=1 Tax=Aldrovandia affinis TaxID=143900 RepID=A0AAD7SPS9_9TELE|nr:hypothetical protein AAFF_G00301660 [Aldrovandia affinis]